MVLSLCANISVSFCSNLIGFDGFEGEFNFIIKPMPLRLRTYLQSRNSLAAKKKKKEKKKKKKKKKKKRSSVCETL